MTKASCLHTICLFVYLAVLVFAAACASKQEPVCQSQSIENELDIKADDYTAAQWEERIDKYEKNYEDISQYNYTDEELIQIGEIQGYCAALFLDKSMQKVQRDTMSTLTMKMVDVIEMDSLMIYYPNCSSIDLCFGTMPDKVLDSNVIFCCEAAYTGQCLNQFRHTNIAGDHVSSGVRYRGYSCQRNTGAFVWYNDNWKFLYQNYSYELDSAAMNGGMGFGQEMLIHKSDIKPTGRPDDNVNVFRALCEVDGKLCIINSKTRVAFGDFKRMCLEYGAKEAIYLDMGTGWNHSWYRNEDGKAVEIFPRTHNYCTNWLTFYR